MYEWEINGGPPVKTRAEEESQDEAVAYLWLRPDGEPTGPPTRKRAAAEEGSAGEAVAYLWDANGEPKDVTTEKRAPADEGSADEAVAYVWDADENLPTRKSEGRRQLRMKHRVKQWYGSGKIMESLPRQSKQSVSC